MNQTPRHVEVIYCDDIREEVGNKHSYMGVYTDELTVPTVPVMLAKFCISVKVITNMEDPFEALEVRIVKVKDNEETDLLTTGPVNFLNQLSNIENGRSRLMVQLTFALAPFQIDEETTLRVKAITEREELRGMALRIRTSTPDKSI